MIRLMMRLTLATHVFRNISCLYWQKWNFAEWNVRNKAFLDATVIPRIRKKEWVILSSCTKTNKIQHCLIQCNAVHYIIIWSEIFSWGIDWAHRLYSQMSVNSYLQLILRSSHIWKFNMRKWGFFPGFVNGIVDMINSRHCLNWICSSTRNLGKVLVVKDSPFLYHDETWDYVWRKVEILIT